MSSPGLPALRGAHGLRQAAKAPTRAAAGLLRAQVHLSMHRHAHRQQPPPRAVSWAPRARRWGAAGNGSRAAGRTASCGATATPPCPPVRAPATLPPPLRPRQHGRALLGGARPLELRGAGWRGERRLWSCTQQRDPPACKCAAAWRRPRPQVQYYPQINGAGADALPPSGLAVAQASERPCGRACRCPHAWTGSRVGRVRPVSGWRRATCWGWAQGSLFAQPRARLPRSRPQGIPVATVRVLERCAGAPPGPVHPCMPPPAPARTKRVQSPHESPSAASASAHKP
jgi:hypothetical protein